MKIVAISGSLRKASLNTMLLKHMQSNAPDDVCIDLVSIKDIPLYNFDDEVASGIPEPVSFIKQQLKAADALLVSTPEYNHSVPGVLKNAFDWLSRPREDIEEVFWGLPVGLVGVSPGRFGTAFSQTAWLPIFRHMNVRAYFGRELFVNFAHTAFADDGRIISADVASQVDKYMHAFFHFVRNVLKHTPNPRSMIVK